VIVINVGFGSGMTKQVFPWQVERPVELTEAEVEILNAQLRDGTYREPANGYPKVGPDWPMPLDLRDDLEMWFGKPEPPEPIDDETMAQVFKTLAALFFDGTA
jgi:hypothetical protein